MTNKNILIYGLKRERHAYREKVVLADERMKDSSGYQEVKLFSDSEDLKEYIDIEKLPTYIDHYNGVICKLLAFEEKKTNDTSCWNSPEALITFEKEKLPVFTKKTVNYPLWEAYFDCWQRNPKNQLSTIYKDKFQNRKNNTEYSIPSDLHIKRGCKTGIDMAKCVDNLTIHFVLDGIDLEAVVTKDDEYLSSYTAIELRYVYRNWEELKEKVIFIEKNEKVPAPWEQAPVLWEKYQPKSKQQIKVAELPKVNEISQMETVVHGKTKMKDVKDRLQKAKTTNLSITELDSQRAEQISK